LIGDEILDVIRAAETNQSTGEDVGIIDLRGAKEGISSQ
jgi:hypothetical protein